MAASISLTLYLRSNFSEIGAARGRERARARARARMMMVVIVAELLGEYTLAVARLVEQLLPPVRVGRLGRGRAARRFLPDASDSPFLVYF